MMIRALVLATATLAALGCTAVRNSVNHEEPYTTAPFYAKYLNTGLPIDAQIQQRLDGLRADPNSATLHNELGTLLVQKGFPKDAEVEYGRAVASDKKYYQAWYNLGSIRALNGDTNGSRSALARTVSLKPGHPQALYSLGLLEEQAGNTERAVALYAKAFRHNPAMMDVRYNPRLVDSRLTHLALIKLYPEEHARRAMQFQGGQMAPKDPATDAAMAAESAKTQPPSASPTGKKP
jgi:tetratricopeptide (TPR) repeat protein